MSIEELLSAARESQDEAIKAYRLLDFVLNKYRDHVSKNKWVNIDFLFGFSLGMVLQILFFIFLIIPQL
jgi:hypothetical protein